MSSMPLAGEVRPLRTPIAPAPARFGQVGISAGQQWRIKKSLPPPRSKRRELTEQVEARPLLAVSLALGAGLLIGAALGRR